MTTPDIDNKNSYSRSALVEKQHKLLFDLMDRFEMEEIVPFKNGEGRALGRKYNMLHAVERALDASENEAMSIAEVLAVSTTAFDDPERRAMDFNADRYAALAFRPRRRVSSEISGYTRRELRSLIAQDEDGSAVQPLIPIDRVVASYRSYPTRAGISPTGIRMP